ncbi:MAG: hypothetical protein ACOX33_09955 [Dethiobacteria bacterium]
MAQGVPGYQAGIHLPGQLDQNFHVIFSGKGFAYRRVNFFGRGRRLLVYGIAAGCP